MEELEDRLGDRMEGLLERIQSIQGDIVSSSASAGTAAPGVNGIVGGEDAQVIGSVSWDNPADDFGEDADAIYDEEMFDDTGEGLGVEGDLDVEDD